jgi:hypothetical protein
MLEPTTRISLTQVPRLSGLVVVINMIPFKSRTSLQAAEQIQNQNDYENGSD